MKILGIIISLAILVFVLAWAWLILGVVAMFVWLLLPIIIGIPTVIMIWAAGYDNIAVIIGICFIAGQVKWSKWDFTYTALKSFEDFWEGGRKPPKCKKCKSVDIECYDTSSFYHEGTEFETRQTTHYNNENEETGYSEYEVEVPTFEKITTYSMRCKNCGAEWKK